MKNLDLVIKDFIKKAKNTNQIGTNLSQTELDEIAKSMNIELPEWYKKLMHESSIVDIEFDYSEYEDAEGYESSIAISDFEIIMSETNDAYPGCAIKELGYVNFGDCLQGSGDPIFINLKEENPKVVRIFHDGGLLENGKFDEDSGNILASDLAVFFENAIFKD